MSIDIKSGDGYKQCPGLTLSGIGSNSLNLDLFEGAGFKALGLNLQNFSLNLS